MLDLSNILTNLSLPLNLCLQTNKVVPGSKYHSTQVIITLANQFANIVELSEFPSVSRDKIKVGKSKGLVIIWNRSFC